MTTMHSMPVATGLSNTEYNKKYTKIQESIETSISLDGKAKISRILCDIKHLSDVEKLLLYLKLPTGVSQDDHLRLTPPSCLHTANRKEQAEAFTWIRSHLEEHGDVCMPKAEVYDEYKQYCENHELRPLCNADFGKMMKQVFPDINTRRLGQRGQSKYFYGGLRKKTDHAPPTLPELEVHTKTLEMDNNSIDNEIFKASCLLICEWADKLLDSKFTSVQSIAEHLVTNLYVNTKSVAAFTLIAAMQENGNHNLKGSALFNSQPSTGGDKHKETNLLLQQKLQKNKLLQKQKEKLQSMKEEIEQQHGSQSQPSTDRKTPSTPVRKSATPSRMSRTPRLPSPSPSPVPLQSPRKPQTKQEHGSATQKNMDKQSAGFVQPPQAGAEKMIEIPIMQQNLGKIFVERDISGSRLDQRSDREHQEASQDESKREDCVFKFDLAQKPDEGSMKTNSARTGSVSVDLKYDSDIEMIDLSSPLNKMEEATAEAETPYNEMETQSCASHVRKINFDGVFEQLDLGRPDDSQNPSVAEQKGNSVKKLNTDSSNDNSMVTEKLSKSDGHVSLKMLLERKDGDKGILNKSLGVLEKSKNTLYVNQSTVSGRSAFVPFSQVQNRKENVVVNQTVSSGIPILIPSSTINQSTSMAMIAVPSNVVTATQEQGQTGVPESIIKLLPSSAAFQFKQGGTENVSQNVLIQSSQSSTLIACDPISVGSSACLTKDTQTFVTSSSLLSKSSSCDSIVSLSPSVTSNASTVAKHARTRFTPIRPKASPNKAAPPKDSKGENPTYDKRPVSEILKEKRAKEQAEAMARLQVGVQLPTIPVQPSLTINRNSLGQLQSMTSTVSAKEVVIIVNNQAGGASVQTMMAPSMFVTNSLVPAETRNQSAEDDKKQKEIYRNQSDSGNSATEIVSAEMGQMVTGETGEDMKMVIEEQEDDAVTVDKQITNDKICSSTDQDKESEHLDKVELMWNETPPKIAKLNITSPYRPESACSLGRDTPVKIMKTADSCSSRPESACSYGRETPSGARKRKSSDLDRRRDFKRLNSTGDEGDDVVNMKLHIDALSPETEARISQNVRRTRSCTYELDKDTRVSYSSLVTEGLQSPDISSLEREALIESGYPQSFCSSHLHKIHTQTSSIGVSAKALRQSQQKLMKNKTDLDQRVKNFLQKDESIASRENVNIEKLQRPKTSQDYLVTKDSVPGIKKFSDFEDFRHGSLQRSKSGTGDPRQDMEPSGLPTEVADWINEVMEKRQLQNPSVMSEPDLSSLCHKANPVSDVAIAEFKFEVGHAVSRKTDQHLSTTTSLNNSAEVEKQQETTFTVPKVPALNSRAKESSARSVADIQGKSARCQSLPSFSSPNQSVLSPVASPVSRAGLFRATSMSPRTHPFENAQPEVTSPMQRNESRESHPLTLSMHAGSKFREDISMKQISRHGSLEEGRMGPNQMGSYLASMQHTLQKPVDNSTDQSAAKPRDILTDTFTNMSSPQLSGQMPNNKSPFGRDVGIPMDRNLSQIPERFVSQTPFSDSGYHSTGPSPILNSTPVSALIDLEGGNIQYQRRQVDLADNPVGLAQQSPVQSPSQFSGQGASNHSGMCSSLQTEPLTTSANSAFVPIQSSSQDSRYVTPIKPTVTLPNSGHMDNTSAYSTNLFIDPNPTDLATEAMMVSPQDHDPPSYETAIRTLRKGFQEGDISAQSNDNPGSCTSIQTSGYSSTQADLLHDLFQAQKGVPSKEVSSPERVSLLANMGSTAENDGKQGMYGPFATKLVQLSKQTQQRPFTVQKSISGDQSSIQPGVSHSEHASPGIVRTTLTESRPMLSSKTDTTTMVNASASNDLLESGSTFGTHSVSMSEPFISNMQCDLPNNIITSEGAISSSVQYQPPSDLDFISATHFSASSNDPFFKHNPSLVIKDHSIEENISQPSSMFNQFNNVLQNETNSAIENQDMLNFTNDITSNTSYRDARYESINISDDGIKNLGGPKEMCGSESEFGDIGLTLEALKELDSQYLGGSELYGREVEGVQQLEEFPMFED